MRRTKIVCTIGPSTRSGRMLERLLRAGMDVARLNFSHGTHGEHAAVLAQLREMAAREGRPLAILQDLSGPKVRLGSIASGPVPLKRGQEVRFTARDVPGCPQEICLPVPELIAALRPGDRLLADDGRVQLAVKAVEADQIVCSALVPGVLSSHKGITAPGVSLDIQAVTPKDVDDLRFGLAQSVDWVAASFVRSPEDLAPLRRVMDEAGVHRPIIAKIEKMEAVKRIESIVAAADGIMVARGDLGVEIPIDEVPLVQKRIIRLCNRAAKSVITATQMLDSMMHNPRPTRAEVTDVANAILDGSDAVMLSGETAAGEYPIEAAKMMARIAQRTDPTMPRRDLFENTTDAPNVTDAVAQATIEIARDVQAAAILCATTSGSTARQIAKYRPDTLVVGATPVPETFRQMALLWGVQPLLIRPVTGTDQMMEETISAVVAHRIAKPGDRVILTAGVPVNNVGNTNLIRVHVVGQPISFPV